MHPPQQQRVEGIAFRLEPDVLSIAEPLDQQAHRGDEILATKQHVDHEQLRGPTRTAQRAGFTQKEISPAASPASLQARNVWATRTADSKLSVPKRAARPRRWSSRTCPTRRPAVRTPRRAGRPSRGRRAQRLRPAPRINAEQSLHKVDEFRHALVGNGVLARRKERELPLKAQDVPRIGERRRSRSPGRDDPRSRRATGPPPRGAALDGAIGGDETPFDLGLEAGRGSRHHLFAGRLRIAELRINS